MKKTHDDTHHYRGSWRDGGCCRIAIYLPEGGETDRRPVIVASKLEENAGSSVTNMAEYLAAEIVARHFPHLLDSPSDGGQPVIWLEHYPPGRGVPGEYDRVTFAPWRIRAAWLGATMRPTFGTPAWARPEQRGMVTPPGRRTGGREAVQRPSPCSL